MGNKVPQMSTELLDDEVKTRVPSRWKQQLQGMANTRGLKVSDLSREALREYLRKQPKQKREVAA